MSDGRGISHRRAVLLAYLKLPHALPVAVVMSVTVALTLIVDRAVAPSRFAAILLSMLGAQLVIGVVNELVDLDLDRAARPDKPLVSGLVSVRGALILLWVAIGLMVAGGGVLGWESLSLCVFGCGIGVAYSVWFKRTAFASVPYLLALPLLPIWVAVSLGEFDRVWLMAYPLGSSAILGVQIAQSVPDAASDKAAGIVSLTTFLGERRSLYLCWAALSLTAIIVGLTGVANDAGRVVALGVIAAVLLNVVIYRLRPRSGARFAFPVAATATASLGVAWAIALTSS